MAHRRRVQRREHRQEDRAAEVAAGYERIIQRFTRWATERPDIRAATIVGSRARQDHPADEWADLDLVMFAADPGRYADDPSWVRELGTPWLTFIEPTAVGGARERRILFEGGLDVDCALIPSAVLGTGATGAMPAAYAEVVRRGSRVLFDRERVLSAAVPEPTAAPPSAPSEQELLEAVNDFWYHAVWTAKHLRRGELWWAKGGCDYHMKELLRRMLEWHTRTVYAPGQDTWMRGRFLEEWADPRAKRALKKTFAHYDEEDVWRALFATMDLFRWLARETMNGLGFPYPAAGDGHATKLVEALAAGGKKGPRRVPSRRPH